MTRASVTATCPAPRARARSEHSTRTQLLFTRHRQSARVSATSAEAGAWSHLLVHARAVQRVRGKEGVDHLAPHLDLPGAQGLSEPGAEGGARSDAFAAEDSRRGHHSLKLASLGSAGAAGGRGSWAGTLYCTAWLSPSGESSVVTLMTFPPWLRTKARCSASCATSAPCWPSATGHVMTNGRLSPTAASSNDDDSNDLHLRRHIEMCESADRRSVRGARSNLGRAAWG
jgi:hypothetical protein